MRTSTATLLPAGWHTAKIVEARPGRRPGTLTFVFEIQGRKLYYGCQLYPKISHAVVAFVRALGEHRGISNYVGKWAKIRIEPRMYEISAKYVRTGDPGMVTIMTIQDIKPVNARVKAYRAKDNKKLTPKPQEI
jgi:hypothetical protein